MQVVETSESKGEKALVIVHDYKKRFPLQDKLFYWEGETIQNATEYYNV